MFVCLLQRFGPVVCRNSAGANSLGENELQRLSTGSYATRRFSARLGPGCLIWTIFLTCGLVPDDGSQALPVNELEHQEIALGIRSYPARGVPRAAVAAHSASYNPRTRANTRESGVTQRGRAARAFQQPA